MNAHLVALIGRHPGPWRISAANRIAEVLPLTLVDALGTPIAAIVSTEPPGELASAADWETARGLLAAFYIAVTGSDSAP